MNLQEALKQEENQLEVYSKRVAQLLENTIIAKALFSHDKKNAGWDEIREQFGDFYLNPNGSLYGNTIAEKITDVQTNNLEGAIKQAVSDINAKCNKKVFKLSFRPRGGVDVDWVK